jgi:hypothetical protein
MKVCLFFKPFEGPRKDALREAENCSVTTPPCKPLVPLHVLVPFQTGENYRRAVKGLSHKSAEAFGVGAESGMSAFFVQQKHSTPPADYEVRNAH